jgi:hypothetical protein
MDSPPVGSLRTPREICQKKRIKDMGLSKHSKFLTMDERMHIMDRFHQEIVPKLEKLHARLGTVNCDFAGEQFEKWSIRFRSSGSGFQVEDLEYDEDACGLELDL